MFLSYSQPLYSCSWVLNWTLSFTLFFKSLADTAFHQSGEVNPILSEFLRSIVNESLADCSLSSTLWRQLFFQSLSPFVHLHCHQPDSFNPGIQPRLCTARWWLVCVILAWSAQYPNYRPGTSCAWGQTHVTERHPIFLWGVYSENPSSVLGPFQLLHLGYPDSDKQY